MVGCKRGALSKNDKPLQKYRYRRDRALARTGASGRTRAHVSARSGVDWSSGRLPVDVFMERRGTKGATQRAFPSRKICVTYLISFPSFRAFAYSDRAGSAMISLRVSNYRSLSRSWQIDCVNVINFEHFHVFVLVEICISCMIYVEVKSGSTSCRAECVCTRMVHKT